MTEPEGPTGPDDARPQQAGFAALAALGVAVLLIVAGGSVGIAMGMRGGTHAMTWGGPGPRLATAAETGTGGVTGGMAMGFQIDTLPEDVIAQYELARANPNVYGQIPCFCGCQDMLGHRNLADCFVTPDGAWESHAAGCAVCLGESRMVMRMMARGMGMGAMRDGIVAEYAGPGIGMTG